MSEVREQLHRAVVFWAHHLRATGQPLPAGYTEAARRLLAAADDADAWLSVDQAARRAGVSVRTIRRWRQRGLASATAGRVIRVRARDLDQWLADQSGQQRDVGPCECNARRG